MTMTIDTGSCKALLLEHNINPASTIEYEINGEVRTVTLEWIIESFMAGSEETKVLFFSSLKKISEGKNPLAMKEYFEKMGQLVILSAFSHKDPVL